MPPQVETNPCYQMLLGQAGEAAGENPPHRCCLLQEEIASLPERYPFKLGFARDRFSRRYATGIRGCVGTGEERSKVVAGGRAPERRGNL